MSESGVSPQSRAGLWADLDQFVIDLRRAAWGAEMAVDDGEMDSSGEDKAEGRAYGYRHAADALETLLTKWREDAPEPTPVHEEAVSVPEGGADRPAADGTDSHGNAPVSVRQAQEADLAPDESAEALRAQLAHARNTIYNAWGAMRLPGGTRFSDGVRASRVILQEAMNSLGWGAFETPAPPSNWCEICQDDFAGESHYHCAKCQRRSSMMGHLNGCPPD